MQDNFSKFRARYILLDAVLVSITFCIILSVISDITGTRFKTLTEDPILAESIGSLAMVAICFSIFYKLKKTDIQPKYLFDPISLRDLPWLMLLIIFYGILSLEQGLSQLTIFFTHLISPSLAELAIKSSSFQIIYNTDSLGLKILFFIVMVTSTVVVAPLIEEFIFRGVLLHRFSAKWGVTSAILISSLLFGVIHMNIHAITIGISSIFISLAYMKTKTLIVPIAFHMMNNAIVVVSSIVYELSNPNNQVEITLETLWAGLFSTAFALLILLYFLKWPDRSDLLPYATNTQQARRMR